MIQNIQNIIFDMDGVIADFDGVKNCVEKMHDKGFFYKLKPLHKNIDSTIQTLKRLGFNVLIMSACPNDISKIDKKRWLKKYVPSILESDMNFCYIGENKADLLKSKGVDIKESVLIDDYRKNITQFKELGGYTIKADFHKQIKKNRADEFNIKYNLSEIIPILLQLMDY